jgi:hypothetical protein
MPYKFVKQRHDYSDYASGKVFYGLPEHPAFPIRLASETFQRSLAARANRGRCTIYDPCCGGAYHLATLCYLHWHEIERIVGSDIDAGALSLARRNLALLTQAGLAQRHEEIDALLAAYGKASHTKAIQSAERLQHRLHTALASHQIKTRLFRADALDGGALQKELLGTHIDLVFTDVPHGKWTSWQSDQPPQLALERLLETLIPVLTPDTVVAIACDKRQKARHSSYQQVERFRIGKRQVFILKPLIS